MPEIRQENRVWRIAEMIWILIVVLCILAVVFLLFPFFTYRLVCYHANRVPDDPHRVPEGKKYEAYKEEMHRIIDDTLSLPYETVSIRSRDGLKLSAKLYRTEGSDTVSLLMHGWHGIPERDFADGIQIHLKHGDSVLLVDQRAHGNSEGHTIAYGVKERYDCLDWIGYLLKSFGPDIRILLHGVSMGAATVMMAAGLALPENVKGIIADSGYISPKEIICTVMKSRSLPASFLYPFVRIGALLYGHVDLNAASALEAMSRNERPALLIHGTGDDFVPFEMGEANYQASKGKKLFVKAEGAPHVLSYLYDKEQYLEKMDEFYDML